MSGQDKDTPIRVLIADDHPIFRQGLRLLLTSAGFEVCAEAGNGKDALALATTAKPQVAILDVNMPGHTGLEVAQSLRKLGAPVTIVILTMEGDEATFNKAMDVGAIGYVLKENAAEDLVDSVRAAARGQYYISPTISQYLVHRRSRSQALASMRPGLDALTKAERRVLRLISEKKTSPQIAEMLFISPRTVDAHRANICTKLGLRGSHSLLQFALENRSALE